MSERFAYPQPLRDPRLRHIPRSEPPDQRPIFHVITLQPLSVHFSSAADNALTRFLRETPQLSFNPVRVAA
jgi:hypothetical protein